MAQEPEIPDFTTASEQLKEFLLGQGHSGQICWLAAEDVIRRNNCFYVRLPLQNDNQELAISTFEVGKQRKLGLRIEVLFVLDSVGYSYVWVPNDFMDAEENGLLMSYFIISIPTSLPLVKAVKSSFKWWLCKQTKSKSNDMGRYERLPSWNI